MTPSLVKSIFPKLSFIFGSFKQGEISIKKLILLVLRVCLYYNYSVSYDSYNTLSASLQNNFTEFSKNYDQKFLEALHNSHSYQKKPVNYKPLKTYDYGQNDKSKKPSVHYGSFKNLTNDNNNSEASDTDQSDSSYTDYQKKFKQNQPIISNKNEKK